MVILRNGRFNPRFNPRRFNPRRFIPWIAILIIVILISAVIWNFFLAKNNRIAKDYQFLSSISPELISMQQQNNPEAWQDYVAVISAFQNMPEESTLKNTEYITTKITDQLDRKIRFSKLNWTDIDPSIKKTAQYCRQVLNKYPIYDQHKYAFPINEKSYFIDTYGADREGGKRLHKGTDIFNKKGTPIINICSGTVEKAGWNRLGGERVGVRGDDGNYYYYAHLDTVSKNILIGERIIKGELIGTMGNTGDAISTPDHLHFGIELPNGEWVNPYPFLKVWEYQKFETN